ncbi:MAG: hypothetical protein ACRDT6_10075 [Micromonosporaceae bacterium]
MAVTQPPSTGLSTQDLQAIRSQLAAGRRPKVVFASSAGQMAGQTGQVVRLDDPAVNEWIVVRFGKDELSFSSIDLTRPERRTRGKRAKPAPQPAPVPPAPVQAAPAQPAASGPARPTGSPSASEPAARSATPIAAARRKTDGTRGRAAKPKPPSELTVTLVWRDGGWTVQANRGAKVVAKPAPVESADALRMVGMLEVPAVQRLVEQIATAERAAAEAQAEKLRQQVAEAEAELAEAEARLAALHALESSPLAS